MKRKSFASAIDLMWFSFSLCTDVPSPSGKIGIFPKGGGTSVHRLFSLRVEFLLNGEYSYITGVQYI